MRTSWNPRRKSLRIGTRGSPLAIKQAEEVRQAVKRILPTIRITLIKIRTAGDKIAETLLAQFASTRAFTKELDEALLAGKIDLAVHSMKDISTELPEGLILGAVTKRRDPSDALISNGGKRLQELPQGARVGTSSLRRKAQLLSLRPDFNVVEMRGNLDTRLRKLAAHEYDAMVVAQAGLERLGWQDRLTERLSPQVILPAVGQGSLGIVIRRHDPVMLRLARRLNHPPSVVVIQAERAFLRRLGGGCKVPVGAMATLKNGRLTVEAVVLSCDGLKAVRGKVAGKRAEAVQLGERLAEMLLRQGAAALMEQARTEPLLVQQDV